MSKVSVIIPVFNAEKTLENTVKSIINQTFSELEVILVNDGSCDKSLSLCYELQKKNQNIKVIDQKNSGVVSAYKKGILSSSGKYIMFCDADDTYEKSFVEEAVKIISEYKCDFVSFASTILDQEKRKSLVLNAADEGFYDLERIKKDILPHCLFNVFDPQKYYLLLVYRWNKIYTKDLLISFIDELDEKCFQIEDNVFTSLAIFKARSFFIDNRAFYNYFLQEKSITKGYDDTFSKYLYSLSVLKNLSQKYLISFNPFQFELLAFENLRIAFHRSAKACKFRENKKNIKMIRSSSYIKNVRLKNIALGKNYLFYFLYKSHLDFILYLAFRFL